MHLPKPQKYATGPLVFVVAALWSLGGCASSNAQLKDQVAGMQKEIKTLRTSAAAFRDRIDALEQEQEERARASRKKQRVPSGFGHAQPRKEDDRPALAVVRLSPTTRSGEAQPKDSGPRPVLRGNARGTSIVRDQTGSSKPGGSAGRGAKRWTSAKKRRRERK